MTRIILNGCCGKMGRMVSDCIALFPDMEIVAGVDRFVSDPPLPYPVFGRIDEVTENAEVIVDFSRPDALTELLTAACDRQMDLVLATTGLSEEENRLVAQAAEHIAIFQAANYSVGIKAMQKLLEQAVGLIGSDSDIEVVETHHNQKVDAPSGTALALAETLRSAFTQDKHFVFGRHGRSSRRDPAEIGIHALRGGTVTGDHEVFFFGQDEVLSVKHHAASRRIFAMGALKAARFLAGQAPGLYGMDNLVEDDSVTLSQQEDLWLIGCSLESRAEVAGQLAALGADELYSARLLDRCVGIYRALSPLPALSGADIQRSVCQLTLHCGGLSAERIGQLLAAAEPQTAAMDRSGSCIRLWIPSETFSAVKERILAHI